LRKGFIKIAEVQIGDFLLKASPEIKSQIYEKVLKIEYNIIKEGYFAPLTSNGTYLVNGYHVSCFCEVDHQIANTFVFPLMLYSRMRNMLMEINSESEGVHPYCKLLRGIGKLLNVL